MTPARRVLHVVPEDLTRGSQVYARALRDLLDGRHGEHRTATLFAARPTVLRADFRLEVPTGRLRALGFDPRAARRLGALVGLWRPDVVVAHGGEAMKYAVPVLSRALPLVYLRIGTSAARLERGWHRAAYRLLFRRASRVVAISQETAGEGVELFGIDRALVTVIPNGRDPDRFRPAADAPTRGEVTLLFVGHLSERKGAERFVSVVRRLRDEGLPVRGVMVGEGPLAHSLATDGVEVLGRRDDVPDLMAASDVFVFAGVDVEGMPGVLIEAGMCGLPVVATDVPGVATVVADGETGLVVPPGDDDALTAAARALVTDPAGRAAMGAAARERCVAHFSLDTVAAQWAALLDEVAAR